MKQIIFLAFLFAVFSTFSRLAYSQCALQTLTPIADSIFYESFSHSFDVDGKYAVVGSPIANSYNYRTGMAYVFEKLETIGIRSQYYCPLILQN
jgi:hypothetical protein